MYLFIQFVSYVRKSHLLLLAKSLPTSVLDKSWPKPPGSMVEVSVYFDLMCRNEFLTAMLRM